MPLRYRRAVAPVSQSAGALMRSGNRRTVRPWRFHRQRHAERSQSESGDLLRSRRRWDSAHTPFAEGKKEQIRKSQRQLRQTSKISGETATYIPTFFGTQVSPDITQPILHPG